MNGIVVLGAGFAGLWIAIGAQKKFASSVPIKTFKSPL
jgi:hypothetical protein